MQISGAITGPVGGLPIQTPVSPNGKYMVTANTLSATSSTARDDRIIGNVGMGGQGVLAIPVIYNGWVQKLPWIWKDQLTPDQLNPIR